MLLFRYIFIIQFIHTPDRYNENNCFYFSELLTSGGSIIQDVMHLEVYEFTKLSYTTVVVVVCYYYIYIHQFTV